MRIIVDSLGTYNLVKRVCDIAAGVGKEVSETSVPDAVLGATTIAGLGGFPQGPAAEKPKKRDKPPSIKEPKPEIEVETKPEVEKKPETNGSYNKTTN